MIFAKLLANRYVAGGVVLLLALLAIWGYGRVQRSQGADQERQKMERQQIAVALGQQVEKDRADAIYRGRALVTQMAHKKLIDELGAADRGLRKLRGQLQTAGACSGLNDAGEDWIGILAASWTGYTDMAAEAGRLADKVTGLQGYIEALHSPVQ